MNGSVPKFFLGKREKLHPLTARAMFKDTIDCFTIGKDGLPVRGRGESDLHDRTARAMFKDTIDCFTVGKDGLPVRGRGESDLHDKRLI